APARSRPFHPADRGRALPESGHRPEPRTPDADGTRRALTDRGAGGGASGGNPPPAVTLELLDPSAPPEPRKPGPTVSGMRCIECGCQKCDSQRGWVTVLSRSGSRRIHYCPGCMANLVSRTTVADQVDDDANDE